VASQLSPHDSIVAFDENGQRLVFDEKGPAPSTPTFVIESSETRFKPVSMPAPAAGATAAAFDETGDGECPPNQEVFCDQDPSGGGYQPPPADSNGDGVPNDAPGGLYMVYSSLIDAKEPWIRGDPEVEVHVMGPNVGDPAEKRRDLTCAGADAPFSDYRFDQNNNTWNGYVLLMYDTKLAERGFVDTIPNSRTFDVLMYEDDDTACQIVDDPYRLLSQAGWLAATVGGAYSMKVACNEGDSNCGLGWWGVAVAAWEFFVGVFTNDDDYLGWAVKKESVPGFYDANATHALIDDAQSTHVNGGIRLVNHIPGT